MIPLQSSRCQCKCESVMSGHFMFDSRGQAAACYAINPHAHNCSNYQQPTIMSDVRAVFA